MSNKQDQHQKPYSLFTIQVIDVLKAIPPGKVMTYGQVALWAGSPRGARQVVRILHSMTASHDLPWHRVINSKGEIALPDHQGFSEQKALLEAEGVTVKANGKIDLGQYLWNGEKES